MFRNYSGKNHQQGAILIVSLVVLLSLSIIAIAALRTSVEQEKISANLRELSVATQSTDSTLREAELTINSMMNTNLFQKSGGGYYIAGDAPEPFASDTWEDGASIQSTLSYEGKVIPPRYFVEYVGEYGEDSGNITASNYGYTDATGAGKVTVFRIVARGVGSSGKAQVIMESFYGKRF